MTESLLAGIYVDGLKYNVYVKYGSFKRKFEIMEGRNSGTSMAIRSIRDILGTGYSFELTVLQNDDHVSDYDSFYEAITAPVESHWFTLPYGQSSISFEGKISSGSDDYGGILNNQHVWNELTISITPMEPQRK